MYLTNFIQYSRQTVSFSFKWKKKTLDFKQLCFANFLRSFFPSIITSDEKLEIITERQVQREII